VLYQDAQTAYSTTSAVMVMVEAAALSVPEPSAAVFHLLKVFPAGAVNPVPPAPPFARTV
jgi:hypothetical protein